MTSPPLEHPARGPAAAVARWGTVALAGVLWSLVILLYVDSCSQQDHELIHRRMRVQSLLREIHRTMAVYADANGGLYPPEADWLDPPEGAWLDTLVAYMLFDAEAVPEWADDDLDLDHDGEIYVYLRPPGGRLAFDPDRIVLYEDPDHGDGFVAVCFDDDHTEAMPREDFDRRLAEQRAADSAPAAQDP